MIENKEAEEKAYDILSSEELNKIKKIKPKQEVTKRDRGEETDDVFFAITSNASHLVQHLLLKWKIRVLDRINFFKLKYDAFNVKELLEIYETQGVEAFINAKEADLRRYLVKENEFFALEKRKPFNENEVVEEMKRCREILSKEVENQLKQRSADKAMIELRKMLKDPGQKDGRPQQKRALSEYERTSWFPYVDEISRDKVVDLRVIGFIRNCSEIREAKVVNYVRALTRGSIASSAETVVEQFLSIAKRQNKINLDWKRLLTRL